MTRTMYDGIGTDAATIASLARAGDLVLTYVDGSISRWSAAELALIPAGVELVTCTATGGEADVVDCEAGDVPASRLEAWIEARKAAGYFRPTVYTSLSNVPAVRQGTGKWVLGKDYDLIVADYDNVPASVYPASVGTQYRTSAGYDVSAIFDDQWPHRTATSPPPKTASGGRMYTWPAGTVLRKGSKGDAVQALQRALDKTGLYGVRNIAKDGDYEDETQTAVHNYEAAEHLAVDVGIAGGEVRASLIARGWLTAAGSTE